MVYQLVSLLLMQKVRYTENILESDKKPAAFKDCETGELYQSIYARILIKRKK
jgi:hypothetical protein